MKVIRIFRIQYTLIVILFIFLSVFPFDMNAFSRDGFDQNIRVENVNWKVEGDRVLITYDLIGPLDQTFFITVKLFRESVSSFKLIPRKTSGDVGKGKFAGKNRVIYWDYLKDVPGGLQGEDFYFEISAEKVTRSKKWLIPVLGGAAAVAVIGTVAILSGTGGGAAEKELPPAPSRPSN